MGVSVEEGSIHRVASCGSVVRLPPHAHSVVDGRLPILRNGHDVLQGVRRFAVQSSRFKVLQLKTEEPRCGGTGPALNARGSNLELITLNLEPGTVNRAARY